MVIPSITFTPGMGRPKKVQKPEMGLVRLRRENQELKTENALLKKVKALVEEREARLRDWAGAIRELRQEGHNLHFMLERIKMARSTYYYNVAHLAPTDKYQAVRSRISEIFAQHHNRYGYRRACIQLRNEGYVINHKTV